MYAVALHDCEFFGEVNVLHIQTTELVASIFSYMSLTVLHEVKAILDKSVVPIDYLSVLVLRVEVLEEIAIVVQDASSHSRARRFQTMCVLLDLLPVLGLDALANGSQSW